MVVGLISAGASAQTTYNDVSDGDLDADGTWTATAGTGTTFPGLGDTGIVDSNTVVVGSNIDATLQVDTNGSLRLHWNNNTIAGAGLIELNGGAIGSWCDWNTQVLDVPITVLADSTLGGIDSNPNRGAEIEFHGAITGAAGVTLTMGDVAGWAG
jgi:hypothetical protein